MTPTRTRARSTVTRFHPNLHHPHLYALLILVVTALVVTLGARSAAPDATAATDKTFETDDHVITQAQNRTITIIDKKTQIAVQDTVDQSSRGPTEEELATQANRLSHQFKNNLGWDLETDADRTRFINETRAFTQQLHNIPQATLDLKENATLRAVRDIVDEMDGTKTCRERCLFSPSVRTIIASVRLGLSLAILKSHMARGEPLHTAQAVAAVILITGQLLAFWFNLERYLHDIPDNLKWIIDLSLGGFVLEVTKPLYDMFDYVAHSRMTLRQEVTDAAQHVDTLTPDDEPATDYDLAKDEL